MEWPDKDSPLGGGQATATAQQSIDCCFCGSALDPGVTECLVCATAIAVRAAPGTDRPVDGKQRFPARAWGTNATTSPSSRLPMRTWPEKVEAAAEDPDTLAGEAGLRWRRPRWLVPGLAIGLVAAAVFLAVALLGADGSEAGADAAGSEGQAFEHAALTPEDERAASYLLTPADFPSGWSTAPSNVNGAGEVTADGEVEASLEASCRSDHFDESAGEASAAFTPGSVFEVTHGVSVFADAQTADLAMQEIPGFLECMVGGINQGALEAESIKSNGAVLYAASFGRYGDETVVKRLEWEMTSPDFQNGAISAYFDFVWVRQGEVVMTFFVRSAVTPFPKAELEALVALGVARIAETS